MLRGILQRRWTPLFGNALWQEYEGLLGRDIWTSQTTPEERHEVLAALASMGRWTRVYDNWRPNLRDEADDHLIELALAAQGDPTLALSILARLDGQSPSLSDSSPD